MAHLSINGLMAGASLCGLGRDQLIDAGEEILHPNVKLLEIRSYRKKSAQNVLLFGTTLSDLPTLCRA